MTRCSKTLHRALPCQSIAALTFAAIAVLRVPLIVVLAALGVVSCALAWKKLAP